MGLEIRLLQDDPVLTFAGRALQTHIGMITGGSGSLQAVLAIDREAPWDYSFSFADGSGSFIGSSGGNVLLAVYEYLRRIGFVFFCPGSTYVPETGDAAGLACEKTVRTASFPHRGVCLEGADSLEDILDFIDWLPKIGCNEFFVQFQTPDVFLERWYLHENNPLLTPEPRSGEELAAMAAEISRAMTLRGLVSHRVGHGWTGAVLGYANTGWHAEAGELPEAKRHLAALVNGKRQLWGGVPTNTNLCYSDPEARALLIGSVTAYAKQHTDADCIHFWLADEYNNICECPACRQTTLSDQYVSMLNELDSALEKEGLPTKIVFLLYQELLYAPLKQRIRNPERFILMFAPISRTFEQSYPAAAEAVDIRPWVRNDMRLPETVSENIAHYFSWRAQFSGDCFFFDYPLGRAHYGDFGYMKIARVIYEDIHSLRALGSRGYMSCQELRAMCPTGFPDYVMGLSLLDEEIPYDTMKETYFRAAFGTGWEAVARYLEELSALSDTDYVNGHGSRLAPELEGRFRRIAELTKSFPSTLAGMEPADPQYADNWRCLEFHASYSRLLAEALADLCTGRNEQAVMHYRAFCSLIRQQELSFRQRLDVYRIQEVTGKYTGFRAIEEQLCIEQES